MASIKSNKSLVTGSMWITLSEFVSAATSLATAIIAARVLAPEDFGHMGIIFVVIGIVDALTRTGFERALIQKQGDPGPYLNVVFTWHMGRGFLLAILLLLSAPFVAAFFNAPILAPAIAVTALYLIFTGAKNPGEVFFTRNLNFKTVCMLNIARALLKLTVAIPAIFIFRNVWALVIEFVAGALMAAIISYIAHSFRPTLEWNWPRARELIGFGKWIFALTILGLVMNKGDDLFIGASMGAASLGLYYYAFEISNWPATKITHVLSRVSFPTYSRLQGDGEALRRAFLSVMRSTLLLSGPLSVAIFALCPYLVKYIIGDHWAPIVPLIQILVVAGLVRSFQAIAGALFQACGHPGLDFKMNLPRALALICLIWPMTARYGLEGACFVILIALALSLPLWFYGVRRFVDVGVGDVLRENMLAIIASTVLFITLMGMDALVYGALPTWPGAVATAMGGLIIWALVMYLIQSCSPWKFYVELGRFKEIALAKEGK